jgi:hypothetical protein
MIFPTYRSPRVMLEVVSRTHSHAHLCLLFIDADFLNGNSDDSVYEFYLTIPGASAKPLDIEAIKIDIQRFAAMLSAHHDCSLLFRRTVVLDNAYRDNVIVDPQADQKAAALAAEEARRKADPNYTEPFQL